MGSSFTRDTCSSFLLGTVNSDCLWCAVLRCLVCLTLFACFIPSHLSLKHIHCFMYMYMYMYVWMKSSKQEQSVLCTSLPMNLRLARHVGSQKCGTNCVILLSPDPPDVCGM